MPNIGNALKAEISRISRKELKGALEAAKKVSMQHRRDIAALKKQISALERALKIGQRGVHTGRNDSAADEGTTDGAPSRRFSATRLAAMRKKLGLSAGDFGKLIGVSDQSIYKWESGQVRPRASQLEGIAKVRALGKRQIQDLLGRPAE